MLTEEEVQEFQRLVFKNIGIELTDEEAMDQGSRLIQLFELLLKYKIDLNSDIENKKRRELDEKEYEFR